MYELCFYVFTESRAQQFALANAYRFDNEIHCTLMCSNPLMIMYLNQVS